MTFFRISGFSGFSGSGNPDLLLSRIDPGVKTFLLVPHTWCYIAWAPQLFITIAKFNIDEIISICFPSLVLRKWNGFVSHEVPFPATSDRRSRVAGNGTEWEVKTIELSSSTSGGEQWAFLNFLILTTVKKTVPKLRKQNFPHWNLVFFTPISFSSLQNMSNAHFGLDAYCESRVSFGVIAKQAI